MGLQTEGSKSSFEDSPVEAEEQHVPFDTLPDANTLADQGQDPGELRYNKLTNGSNGHTCDKTRPNALAPIRSRISTRSHQSYEVTDGYATFNEDDGDETIPEAKEEGQVGQANEFIVSWDGEEDPMNPKNSHSLARKWLIVLILSASSLCVTCASSMYTFTYAQIEAEWGCSREVATLGLSLFVIGLGTGPLVLSPASL